jgi:predicted DsbA family dithiol-disulfide isomerase
MVGLQVYYDFASPFCYIARAVVARLRAEQALQVRWLPFETIDYLPARGAMPQNPAFVRRGEAARTARLAAEYGLEVHLRDRLLNSNLALCAVERAYAVEGEAGQEGLADAVLGALFDAFYREERDIGKLEVVLDVAAAAGLSSGLEAALQEGTYRESVAQSRAAAHALGVVAVPTFLAGGNGIVGIPEFAAFEQLIQRASG